MTVLQRKEASGVAKKSVGFGSYIVVGVVAAAIGVASVAGVQRLGGTDELTPPQIAQIRASEYSEFTQNQWIAQVNATRNADLVEFYEGKFFAGLAAINEQRARDMIDHYAGLHSAKLAQINEQRAKDMVTYKWGWEGETGR